MARIDNLQSKLVCNTSGFTLMEVLISMFIMTVGILGVISLQMTSLRMNRDSLMSVEAIQMISDLVDRISANPAGAYAPIALGDAPENGSNCAISNCTSDQMATYDISSWLCAINSADTDNVPYPACVLLGIDGSFPQGQGSITLVDDQYRILLQWVDNHLEKIRFTELYLGAN